MLYFNKQVLYSRLEIHQESNPADIKGRFARSKNSEMAKFGHLAASKWLKIKKAKLGPNFLQNIVKMTRLKNRNSKNISSFVQIVPKLDLKILFPSTFKNGQTILILSSSLKRPNGNHDRGKPVQAI